tara:strand:+ start:501 stop:833 length:333 start_codon:yes stop_codon:yes gene_type:complete
MRYYFKLTKTIIKMETNKKEFSTFTGVEVWTILSEQQDKVQAEFELTKLEWRKKRLSHKQKDIWRTNNLREDMEWLQGKLNCLDELLDEVFQLTSDDCNEAFNKRIKEID